MRTQIGCPICRTAHCAFIGEDGGRSSFECEVCGPYSISGSALAGKLKENAELTPIQRAVLSHRIREANDSGRDPPLLTTDEIDDVVANGRLPTPAQQAINIIRFVGEQVAGTGRPIRALPLSFHAIVGSPNRDFALR